MCSINLFGFMTLRTQYIITLTSANVKLGAQEILAGPCTLHTARRCALIHVNKTPKGVSFCILMQLYVTIKHKPNRLREKAHFRQP